mmetsp:Transcript_30554/g.99305  ORF Transcript_30554/g.99305 Transcript_30554/m.99305 type:complete len:521 (+) Transcript_30554:174-1736(+)
METTPAAPSWLLGTSNVRVRVWWPCNDVDNDADDLSTGMYWHGLVTSFDNQTAKVRYDNGDSEDVPFDRLQPANLSVNFGHEPCLLAPEEYCEVLATTEDGETFARVVAVNEASSMYTVSYPFHDVSNESWEFSRVRRARTFDAVTNQWLCISPEASVEGVSSPMEMQRVEPMNAEDDEQFQPQAHTPSQSLDGDSSKKRKLVKRKDPRAPKRAKTAYLVYLGRHRDECQRENPTWDMAQITRHLADKWKHTVTEEELALCEAEAKEDKERYSKELSKFKELPPEELSAIPCRPKGKIGRPPKNDAPIKKSVGPRKPHNAYICFLMEYKALAKQERPELGQNEVATECSKAWKALDDEGRAPYARKAQADKVRYETELAEWLAKEREENDDAPLLISLVDAVPELAASGGAAAGEAGADAKGSLLVMPTSRPTSSAGMPRALLQSVTLSMKEVKQGLATVATEEAYYRIVEKMREDRALVNEAAANYLDGNSPDFKAFLIHALSLSEVEPLLLSSVDQIA